MKTSGPELLDKLLWQLDRLRGEKAQRDSNLADQEYDLDDCFVSARANALAITEAETKIFILGNEGLADFPALFTLDGEFITSDLVKTKYGNKFVTPDGHWVEPYPKRQATLAKKGFKVERILLPAWAALKSYGHGLAGLAGTYVKVFPSSCNYWTGETLEEWQERIGRGYLDFTEGGKADEKNHLPGHGQPAV